MNKILIATTNKGKFAEIVKEFSDLDLEFLSLKDVGLDKIDLEEPYNNLWENALHKARYFAKKSKFPTIAEDSGFFVKFLKGEPGVYSKRYGSTATARCSKILKKMEGVPEKKRQAYFMTQACIYNPKINNFTIFTGKVNGLVAQKKVSRPRAGMDYDAVFYYPPYKKTFSEVSLEKKNEVSHRGQVVAEIKRFLMKQYGFKQLLVVGGIIVKDRKMLLQKRRDNRKDFDGKWEFVGGGVDNGESVSEALKREVKEESGYNVEPVEQLPEIVTKTEYKFEYQVFLLLYICKIKSGRLIKSSIEASDHGWFTVEEALKLKSLPANNSVIRKNIDILKKYVD